MIDALETNAGLLVEAMAEQRQNNRVTKAAQMQNTKLYAIKLTHNDDAIFAVRKTDSSWQTREDTKCDQRRFWRCLSGPR